MNRTIPGTSTTVPEDVGWFTSPAVTGLPIAFSNRPDYAVIRSSKDIGSYVSTSQDDILNLIAAMATGSLKSAQTVDQYWGSSLDELSNPHILDLMCAVLFNRSLDETRGALGLTESKSALFEQNYPLTVGATLGGTPAAHLEDQLVDYFQGLGTDAIEEVFLDGMESNFSRRLTTALEAHGETAVHAIERIINLDAISVEVVGETLRQIGYVEDLSTHQTRMTVLVRQLESTDPRIRDAAALGLAALDDPQAIDSLLEALNRESSSQLKGNLRIVLNQLQNTKWPNS